MDYGKRKVGVALASDSIAEPLCTLENEGRIVSSIKEIAQKEKVEAIVIGLSEGKTASETRKFASKLEKKIGLPIFFVDETLSSYEARELSLRLSHSPTKRKQMEDAMAAALVLQYFIESGSLA